MLVSYASCDGKALCIISPLSAQPQTATAKYMFNVIQSFPMSCARVRVQVLVCVRPVKSRSPALRRVPAEGRDSLMQPEARQAGMTLMKVSGVQDPRMHWSSWTLSLRSRPLMMAASAQRWTAASSSLRRTAQGSPRPPR